jgi:tRNA threonylcarbamoyladenosine biosynthesis protein TsaE
MNERRIVARTLSQTHGVAEKLAEAVRRAIEGGASDSVLVGLLGELGAGKTALVQGFVRALHPEEDLYVTSPTFAIVQEYRTVPPVTHMDLYRISGMEELEALGYRDLYFAPGVTIVEWIDRVPEAIPAQWIEVRIQVLEDEAREIRIRPHGRPLEALFSP